MPRTIQAVFLFSITVVLTVILYNAVLVSEASAATWTEQTSAGTREWKSISVSDDGLIVGAVTDPGYVYVSSDSGLNWEERTGPGFRNWRAISLSENGAQMAAVSYSLSQVHTSSDSGATWVARTASDLRSWHGVAVSADGLKIIAAAFGNYIYSTENGGTTWTSKSNASGSRNWYAVTSSDNGSALAAVVNGGYLYTSADAGTSWTQRTSLGSKAWYMVSSSGDGSKIAAVVDNGYLYTSEDAGESWTEHTDFANKAWRAVAVSDDGLSIVAAVGGGYLYSSPDFGDTWVTHTDLGTKQWLSLAITADGNQVFAGVSNGYIYKGVFDTTAPTITSVSSNKTNGTYTLGEVIDIDVSFSEAVTSDGVATVTLETGVTDRTCTFTVSNADVATCNYTVQTGDTTTDLTVTSISGVIEDQAGNAMSDFSIGTNLAANKALVIDTTAPTVSMFTPSDDTIDVAIDSDVVIEFSEVVDAESGNITIYKASDDSVVEEIDVAGGLVSGSGTDTITINPIVDLTKGVEYYIQVDSTAFDDNAGNSFVGIVDENTWNFTTVIDPGTLGGGSNRRLIASCTPSDRTIRAGEDVRFNVSVDTSEDEYDFEWTKVLTGDDVDETYTFNTAGTFYPRGRVSAGRAGKAVVSCGTITVSGDSDAHNDNDEDRDEGRDNRADADTDKDAAEDAADTTADPALIALVTQHSSLLLNLVAQGVELPKFVQDVLRTLLTNQSTVPVGNTLSFTVDLELGDTHPDVLRLQQFLNTRGFPVALSGPGSVGNETTTFGYATQNALIKFQQANNIRPAVGYFGQITRTTLGKM